MRHAARWLGIPVIAALAVLAAGCATDRNFVYKPNLPATAERRLPVKVGVLPFADGTGDFTLRGSIFSDGQYNLAKTGVGGGMSALPPELWGKSFADDLAASGSFQSVRFAYSSSELKDEAFMVEGTLKKALYATRWDSPNEILVSFRATRLSDRKVVWEKETGTVWKDRPEVSPVCRMSPKCLVGKMQEDWNRRMSSVFAEAGKDLVGTFASLPEGGAGGSAGSKPEGNPPGDSVERTIDKILKGK